MRLKTLLIVLGLCTISYARAQEHGPSVVSPAGGFNYTSALSLDWTLGEIAIETNRAGEKVYTEGFHQPVVHLENVEKAIEYRNLDEAEISVISDMEITVAPNPVRSILYIRVASNDPSEIILQFSDITGKTVLSTVIDPVMNSMDLDLSFYASGLYLLQFIDSLGRVLETHKVIKVQ